MHPLNLNQLGRDCSQSKRPRQSSGFATVPYGCGWPEGRSLPFTWAGEFSSRPARSRDHSAKGSVLLPSLHWYWAVLAWKPRKLMGKSPNRRT